MGCEMTNLSRGVTILRKFNEANNQNWDDPRAYEVGDLISKCEQKRFRQVKRHIKGVTGLKYRQFVQAVTKRTSHRWVHFNLEV